MNIDILKPDFFQEFFGVKIKTNSKTWFLSRIKQREYIYIQVNKHTHTHLWKR